MDDRAIGLVHGVQIRFGSEVLHQHFADALALERHVTGEHFVENDAQGVGVDLPAVAAVGNLGRHVVDGADALGLATAAAAGNKLRQSIVADLDGAFVEKDIRRLQVAVDDAVVVQIGHAGSDAREPLNRQSAGMPLGMAIDGVFERFARHVFHDHPAVVVLVGFDVVEGDQVGVLEIQAVRDAAEFDVEIAANQFERDFFAGVAHGVIDFAEAAAADASFDRVSGQRLRAARIGKARTPLGPIIGLGSGEV